MSADTLAERIREIKEREAKATKGPWNYRRDKSFAGKEDRIIEVAHNADCDGSDCKAECLGGHVMLREDATPYWANRLHDEASWAFIAHARADIPWLVEQLEKALPELSAAEQAERERCCKDVCDYCRHDGPPVDCRNEDHATPAGDDGYPSFMHRYDDGTEHECEAAAIRNRE